MRQLIENQTKKVSRWQSQITKGKIRLIIEKRRPEAAGRREEGETAKKHVCFSTNAAYHGELRKKRQERKGQGKKGSRRGIHAHLR